MVKGTFYRSPNVKDAFLKALEDNLMVLVYDLETTGLSPVANHIIQISARRCFVTRDGLEEVENMEWYINPGYSLPEKIVELTGIEDKFLADKPAEADVIREIADFFDTDTVCGFNNHKFDDLFMEEMYRRYGGCFAPKDSIDVYKVAKSVIKPGATENYKLKTVANYLGLSDEDALFHNAAGDTGATLFCFNQLIGLCREKEPEYSNLIPCVVSSVRYYKNPNNWKVQRIYVDTNNGMFWLDAFNGSWHTQEVSDRIGRYDMRGVITQVLQLTGAKNEEELLRFRNRVTA